MNAFIMTRIFTFALMLLALDRLHAETVRVMTFNLWIGGEAGKQPLTQTVAAIQLAKADVVGLQETEGLPGPDGKRPDNTAKLAKMLGWHYLDQGGRTAILSRYPIVSTTPRKWGVKLALPSGGQFYVFNVHLAAAPYQPYQLLGIPFEKSPPLKTEAEAVQSARSARLAQTERMLAEVKAVRAEGIPIFLTGDFNEPSHLDWTAAAAQAQRCPLKVDWPTSNTVVAAGFADAYRTLYPDPVTHPGLTWTPITKPSDPKDRHDRIDRVYFFEAKVTAVKIVGESAGNADVFLARYPSDHRAVVVEAELARKSP